jgi:UDP-glucose 4-epimerase
MNVRFSVDNPKEDAVTNIIGSINLYEACKNSGVKKIIFASSGGTIYENSAISADEEHRRIRVHLMELQSLQMKSIYFITTIAME